MSEILAIQSFRGGVGRTLVATNLAYLAASRGRRVAIVDVDLQCPGPRPLSECEPELTFTLADVLAARCGIEEAAYDLTRCLGITGGGRLWFVPPAARLGAILRLARGYDTGRLEARLRDLIDALGLDLLVIDTPAGVNPETLMTAAIADRILVLVRQDGQDARSAGILHELAGTLLRGGLSLVVNMVEPGADAARTGREVERALGREVRGVLPFDAEVAVHGGRGVFARTHPRHPYSVALRAMADAVLDQVPPAHLPCAVSA